MPVSQCLKNLIWSFALTIVAVGCTESFAHAQEARGRFTLPYEVHCAGATLPAGEYLYSFDLGNPTPVVVSRKL
jgi:hypothetical protein